LRSPFGPLRLILKSLTTPSDAASKARGLLAMVPSGSIFGSIRAAAEATLADDAELLAAWSGLRPAQRTLNYAAGEDEAPAASRLSRLR
jgi:hypothetical protein